MKGRDKRYAFTRERVYELDDGWEILSHMDTQVSPQWEYLDFGPYVLMSNGVQIFACSPSTGDLELITSSSLPPMRTMCNYNGMIVGGGISGLDPDWVAWSQVGHASFEIDRSGLAGRRPLMEVGEVFRILPLGEGVVVYGSDGIGLLRLDPDIGAMAYRVISYSGIKGFGSVAGDKQEHVFIGSDNTLRALTTEFQVKELGYKEFFNPLVNPIISFDPIERDWYISDATTSYVYGSSVLFSCFQSVSSLVKDGATIISHHTQDAHLLTDVIPVGLGGRKSVEAVEVISHKKGWSVQGIGDGNSTSWIPTNPTNQARVKITGGQLQIGVRHNSYIDVSIEYINVMWKLSDKRFVRGMYASSNATRTNQ